MSGSTGQSSAARNGLFWRRAGGWLLAGLVAAGIIAAAFVLPAMRRATARREAYLPQLEAESARAPYDGPLLALLGGRLTEAHEFRAAARTLERAIAVGEKTPPVWLTLAAADAASGNPGALAIVRVGRRDRDAPELRDALARASALGPHPTAAALARALCPDGASPLLARYAAGSPLNGWAERAGRRRPARSGFETRRAWAAAQPNDAEALRWWGLALLQNRRAPEAGPVLERAVVLAPASPAAWLAAGEARDALGSPSSASLAYLAALKRRPDWAPALEGLGRDALALGLPGAAADVFARAVRADGGNADAWAGLGRADVRAQQNYDQALAAFGNAARIAPGRTDFLDDYALALKSSARAGEAEALLRRRLQAAPDDAFASFSLGTVLLDDRPTPAREAEAEARTRAALRLDPSALEARRQLGRILLGRGRTAEGLALLRSVLAADPSDVQALRTLAGGERQAGRPDLAARFFAQAGTLFNDTQAIDVLKAQVQQAPSDAALHARLAALYARTGQAARAAEERNIVALLRAHPDLKGAGTQTLEGLIRAVTAPEGPAH